MFPRGGPYIAAMVGWACEAICMRGVEPLLPELTVDQLEHVARRLHRILGKRVPFGDTIMEEKWLYAAGYQETLNDPKSQSLRAHYQFVRSMTDDGEDKPLKLEEAVAAVKFILADKEAILRENMRCYDALAAEARQPYDGTSKVNIPDNMLATGLGLVAQIRAKSQAREAALEMVGLEVALLRYERVHGRFPAQLSALAPSLLAVVPDDPLGGGAGKPFHYSVTPDGHRFTLYSLGANMKDDKGRSGRFPGDENGDIVVGRLWRGRAIPAK